MVTTEHRVATHLRLAASDYDAQIRRYTPRYEEMIDTVVAIIAARDAPYVIDLGAGTGALGGAILDRVPRARVRFLDIDPAMLEVAGARVAAHGARAELCKGAFDDPLPACDVVVASLALHHVPERDRKRALYARVHDALRPGGVLLVADITVHETGLAHDHMYGAWIASMASHGIAGPEARALLAQWAGEDRYYPLAAELAMLAAGGFARPECFWKHGPSTVFGGFRG
ncbi:MAG TPA: class I SAM-dependent methyltransferase [Kofleriaceae bacterium]|jgi:tRNA (cmo5U34)-methyltransferase|nr:class I SAM-dependent methyltransferase [Kofleriaceae bacterium]